ncbi:MAG: hypothetical protein ABL901_10940 [Hyphomicrobiaceae bacterium]
MMSSDVTEDKGAKSTNGTKGVAEQITLLKNDLSGLAKEVTSLAKEKIDETVGEVQDAAAGKVDDITNAIRHQPMQATIIAAGIGFVFGLLLTR